jgi:hypothetical protein
MSYGEQPTYTPMTPEEDPAKEQRSHLLRDLTLHQLRGRIGRLDGRLDGKGTGAYETNHQQPDRGKNEALKHHLIEMLKWQQGRRGAFQRQQGLFSPQQVRHDVNRAQMYGPNGYSGAMKQNLGMDQQLPGYGGALPTPSPMMTSPGPFAAPAPAPAPQVQQPMPQAAPAPNPLAMLLAGLKGTNGA